MIKKKIITGQKEKLLLLSIPINAFSILLRFGDIYLMLGQVLLLSILNGLILLYIQNGKDKEHFFHSPIPSIGFLFIMFFATFADLKYYHFFFLFGVGMLAVYSELNFSIMSILSYFVILTILSIGTDEYRLIALFVAIALAILVRYFSDLSSLLYVLVTILSLCIILFLVLNSLSLNHFLTETKVIDLVFITLAVLFSYFLYSSKKKSMGFSFFVKEKSDFALLSPEGAESNSEKEVDSSVELEEMLKRSFEKIEEEENERRAEEEKDQEEVVVEEQEESGIDTSERLQDEETLAISFEKQPIQKESILEETVYEETVQEERNESPAITEEIAMEETEMEELEAETEEPILKDYRGLLSDASPLFSMIREYPSLYEESLRRAFLCESLAEVISADTDLAAAGGFYATCGKMKSDNYIKESLKLLKQFDFPDEIILLVKEHHFKIGIPSSKEGAIVLLVHKLDSTIRFFEEKKKKFPLSQIVDTVIDAVLMNGKFDVSGLSVSDYKKLKDYMMEEVSNYYDSFY